MFSQVIKGPLRGPADGCHGSHYPHATSILWWEHSEMNKTSKRPQDRLVHDDTSTPCCLPCLIPMTPSPPAARMLRSCFTGIVLLLSRMDHFERDNCCIWLLDDKHTPCLISATPSNDQNICEANVATTQSECQPCLRLRRDLSDAVPSWEAGGI